MPRKCPTWPWAYLVTCARASAVRVYSWQDANQEVDCVLAEGDKVVAVEVKTSSRRRSLPGLDAFAREFTVQKKLPVGGQGIPLEEFLTTEAEAWF